MEDPHPLVSGRGVAILRDHGIDVQVGLGREDAARLNQPFLTAVREGRPFVILKAATSLDGRLAAAAGERTQLTSETAVRHAHSIRAQVDAVAIGSGTLLVDDPLLTSRHVYRERPLTRVIFDRRLRTVPTARVFSTLSAGPVIIVTSRRVQCADRDRSDSLERAGATVLALDDPAMAEVLRALAGHDIQSIVLEGGPALHQAAWDAGVVDYVQLYIAPMALGGNGSQAGGQEPPAVVLGPESTTASLIEKSVRMLGPDVLIEGYVHRPR